MNPKKKQQRIMHTRELMANVCVCVRAWSRVYAMCC